MLAPILGIGNPRTDGRIEFVGGIRGLRELERKVNRIDARGDGPAVAFAMFPTSIDELLNVADAGRLMPPKSTWFEPKLRSGLFANRGVVACRCFPIREAKQRRTATLQVYFVYRKAA